MSLYQEPKHHLLYLNQYIAGYLSAGTYAHHTLAKYLGTDDWLLLGRGLSAAPHSLRSAVQGQGDTFRLGLSYGEVQLLRATEGIFLNPAAWGLIAMFDEYSGLIHRVADGVLNIDYIDIPYRVYKKSAQQAKVDDFANRDDYESNSEQMKSIADQLNSRFAMDHSVLH